MEQARPEELFKRPDTPKPQEAIGFRIDRFYIKRLSEEGEKHGLSAAEYARRLVIRGLEEPDKNGVASEMKALRKELVDMFYLLLVTKLGANEAEAAEIVRTISGGK